MARKQINMMTLLLLKLVLFTSRSSPFLYTLTTLAPLHRILSLMHKVNRYNPKREKDLKLGLSMTSSRIVYRLFGVPENSASLWTTYELQSGDLQGLGFGLGFNFVGERQGDLANSFKVDSHFLTNAAIFYRRNNWQARLNINNLFNIDFIESVNGGRVRQIYPGDPLTIRASVSVEF